LNREVLYSALFAKLTAPPLNVPFLASIQSGQRVIGVVDTTNLVIGMPISGPGMQDGALLTSLDPVTLSLPATQSLTNTTLTQGFATAGRRIKQLGIESFAQPGLFLVEGPEIYPAWNALTNGTRRHSNSPAIIRIEPYLLLYSLTVDQNANPNQVMNTLLDGIDTALEPPPGTPNYPWQNLGLQGVFHCRIEGKTVRSPGTDATGQVKAVVNLAIEVLQGIPNTPL
jgi:hypothetical protein